LLAAIDRFACHPGGPKVIAACERACGLEPGILANERAVVRDFANMSAAAVLFVLERVLGGRAATAGAPRFARALARPDAIVQPMTRTAAKASSTDRGDRPIDRFSPKADLAGLDRRVGSRPSSSVERENATLTVVPRHKKQRAQTICFYLAAFLAGSSSGFT
jgi:hypothetical protein